MTGKIKEYSKIFLDASLFDILKFLSLLSIALMTWLFIYSLDTYFQHLNLKIKSYKIANHAVPKDKFDPFLSNVYTFDNVDEMNGNVVSNILRTNKNIKDFIGEKKFDSFYGLSSYLLSNHQYDIEFQLLEQFTKKNSFDETYYKDVYDYVNHLNTHFVKPIHETIEYNCFARAQWLVNNAAKRLDLIDTNPSIGQDVNRLINQILLYRILLSNPKESFIDSKLVKKLSQAIQQNFNKRNIDIDDEPAKTKELNCLLKYIEGVSFFQNDEYILAYKKFDESETCTERSNLRELSKLLKARCIFWGIKDFKSGFDKKELEEILNGLNFKNYRSDLIFYLNELKGAVNLNNFSQTNDSAYLNQLSLEELLKIYIITVLETR